MIAFNTLDAAWRDERARRLARYRRLPALAERGLELGAMTVLAKRTRDRWGAIDLALDGGEGRILALLAVAYWHPVSPSVIGYLRRAAKAMARGDQALAAIHIAHTGLAKIDEDERIAFRLFAAERLLDAGVTPRELMTGLGLDPWPLDAIKYDADEPRDAQGRWTDGAPYHLLAKQKRFFDTLREPVQRLAQRLGIDEDWLLGLSAWESGWLNDHNRALNNPFGLTHGGKSNLSFLSVDDAVSYFERRWGPRIADAASAADFISRLEQPPQYNSKNPEEWSSGVAGAIRSIERAKPVWASGRQ